MTIVAQLPAEVYLKGRGIKYELAPHEPTDNARGEASALGLPPCDVVKAVMLKTRGELLMAVLPASEQIDLGLMRRAVSDPHLRLATEEEIGEAFPGFELGALPPLPGLLGVRSYVDPHVFDHHLAAFADGRRTESIVASTAAVFWGEDVTIVALTTPPSGAGWRFDGDSAEVGELYELD